MWVGCVPLLSIRKENAFGEEQSEGMVFREMILLHIHFIWESIKQIRKHYIVPLALATNFVPLTLGDTLLIKSVSAAGSPAPRFFLRNTWWPPPIPLESNFHAPECSPKTSQLAFKIFWDFCDFILAVYRCSVLILTIPLRENDVCLLQTGTGRARKYSHSTFSASFQGTLRRQEQI